MQYLLKISITDTRVWRLVAIEGKADIAHIARLISLAFDYGPSVAYFIVNGNKICAGSGGEISNLDEARAFDTLNLKAGDEFIFKCSENSALEHKVNIMKAEEHLYCLIPSCLIGSGRIPGEKNLDVKRINDFDSSEEEVTLDFKRVTNNLRECGSQRADMTASLDRVAKDSLNYIVKN